MARSRIVVLFACIVFSAAAAADVVTRRSGKVTFATADGGGVVAQFDLSDLPKDAKIYRARLLPGIRGGGFPMPEPIVVNALTAAHESGQPPAVEGKALALVPPRFVAFEATDVVQRWASGKLANHGLLIRGAKVEQPRAFLEIAYEGKLAAPPPPVTGLKAFHRAGQVFLTWNEVNSTLVGKDEVTWDEFRAERERVRKDPAGTITYRIYRHTQPIAAATLGEAELLDEVDQFSCFDERMVETEWKGEQIKNVKVGSARVPRAVVEPMTELKPGTGVWVRTTDKPGKFHYAVIAAVDGVENTMKIDDGCATAQPLDEKVAPPEPILFKEFQMQYQQDRTLFCYYWWVDPPLNHLPDFIHVGVTAGPKLGNPPAAPGQPEGELTRTNELIGQLGSQDAKARRDAEAELVKIGPTAVPSLEQAQKKTPPAWGEVPKLPADAGDADKARAEADKARLTAARQSVARALVKICVAQRDKGEPAPLIVHGYWWSGGWGSVHPCPQPEGVTLSIDDHPWRMRGVHEGNGTLKAWSQGKVQNYYVRQIKALLPWVKDNYHADLERVYAFSGAWAWHYPEVFAATFEVLSMNPKRSPALPEARLYWNDPKTPAETEWGMSPYEYWNAGEWIKNNPAAELAFMSYTPYQHTGDFGRIDKPAFFAAMRDTKHAFAATFDESRGWYGMVNADWVLQLRRTDSVPAFTNCTLDDNPGIGLGWDPGGQINAYLCAEPRTQVDQPGRWEMTVYLYGGDSRGRDSAPLDTCTADVTARRCQQFKAKPGEKFTWTNKSIAENKDVQTGTAEADEHGLVTAKNVVITKGKNRLILEKAK